MNEHHAQFFRELRELLERYSVEISAYRQGEIEIQFPGKEYFTSRLSEVDIIKPKLENAKPTRGCNLCDAHMRASRKGEVTEAFQCGACHTSYKVSKKSDTPQKEGEK